MEQKMGTRKHIFMSIFSLSVALVIIVIIITLRKIEFPKSPFLLVPSLIIDTSILLPQNALKGNEDLSSASEWNENRRLSLIPTSTLSPNGKQKKQQVAILLTALGGDDLLYLRSLSLIRSLDRLFEELNGTEASYFVFSNDDKLKVPNRWPQLIEEELGPDFVPSVKLAPLFEDDDALADVNDESLDAPRRCATYIPWKNLLKNQSNSYDFILSLDSKLRLKEGLNTTAGLTRKAALLDAIIRRNLTVGGHPTFSNKTVERGRFPYEMTNVASCAYLTQGEAAMTLGHYYASHAFGGRTQAFFDLCDHVASCWRQDLSHNIKPDDSSIKNEIYLNKYMLEEQPAYEGPIHLELGELFNISPTSSENGSDYYDDDVQEEITGETGATSTARMLTIPLETPQVKLCSRIRWQLTGDDKAIGGGHEYCALSTNNSWSFADSRITSINVITNTDENDHVSKNETLAIASSDIRGKQAAVLKDSLARRYFDRMTRLFEFEDSKGKRNKNLGIGELCHAQFLAFFCTTRSEVSLCGGYGDRTRGLISAAAIAIGSRRIFHIEWTKNSRLDEYFYINNHFYNVSLKKYRRPWKTVSYDRMMRHQRNFVDSGAEPAFVDWAADPTFRQRMGKHDCLIIFSNSMAGIEGAVKNPTFRPVFDDLFQDLGNETKFDVSIFASAILQTIFGRPTDRLTELVERCLINATAMPRWHDSYRIGMQIRCLRPSWNEGGERVAERHLPCFVDELARIVSSEATRQKMKQSNKTAILVFLTSDSESAIRFLRNAIKNHSLLGGKVDAVVTSDDNCSDMLSLVHSDRDEAQNETTAWMFMAKPYVDWLGLTMMDRLIISRSGFAESASLFSLKPTSRLVVFNRTEKCPPFQSYNSLNMEGLNGGGIRFDQGL